MNWITCWAPAKQRSSDLDGTVVCCCCLGLANLGRNEAQINHFDMGVPSFGHWTHWTYKSNKKWMVQWLILMPKLSWSTACWGCWGSQERRVFKTYTVAPVPSFFSGEGFPTTGWWFLPHEHFRSQETVRGIPRSAQVLTSKYEQ